MWNEGDETGGEGVTHRVHLALTGTVVASPALVKRHGRAAWLARLVHDATIDDRVPFATGLAYRLALDGARRAGPEEPVRSAAFLPVPTSFRLGPELTVLCRQWPVLRDVPRSMLTNALDEGCRARDETIRKLRDELGMQAREIERPKDHL